MFRALSRVGGAAARRSASGSSLSIAADVSGSSLSVAAGVDTRLAPSAFHAGLVAGRLGASASLAGTGAARFASSNSLARTVAARLGSSPSPAAAGPARLGPSSAFARGISTNNPPPGVLTEQALYKKMSEILVSHGRKLSAFSDQFDKLLADVSEAAIVLKEGADAGTAGRRLTIVAGAAALVLFAASALFLLYSMVRRKESMAVKASSQVNSSVVMAAEKMEKAAIAAEKAAVAMAVAADRIAAASASAEKETSAESTPSE
ncbi:unnamed protein product [Urochloa humidicola]